MLTCPPPRLRLCSCQLPDGGHQQTSLQVIEFPPTLPEMWTIFCMFTLNFQKEVKRIRWRCIFRQMGLVGPLVGGIVGGLGLTSASVASALWQRPCYVYTALSGGQSSLDFAFLLCFIKTTKTCNKVKRNYDLGFICVTDITVEYNIFMLPQAACSTPVNWFNLHP